MGARKTIRGRYEIKAIIGRGGMGVVYRAYDPVMKREVAIKTLHDISSQPVLDLFYRECAILKGIVHPNVIDILDMGDFEDEGVIKPYYVMPLLPGKTLYDLLHPSKDATEPLSVDRAVEIIVQTSRGLHAAHERDLLHRDVKPRNIFVIDEYSVKLIDFGVAHLLGSNSTTGVKGTLEYMSPEQLKMKPLSRRTDIFSLATVCYEILTGTQPFRCTTEAETAAAVVNTHPVLACDLNHSVPKAISQVISKGMAKEPLSRFATVAEFAEALQRARRNEPLTDLFDPTESRIRLQRAQHSFEQGDYQFASEVLRELESEGQVDGAIQALRRRVDEALQRQATAGLYESAKRYFDTEEYSLALRKAQEILELDGTHAGAIVLKKKIEDALAERRVAEMLHSAAERLEHAAFTEARKTLQDAQRLRPDDSRVRQLLSEVDSRQKEFLKQRQEQERLYQSSQAAWVQRDISLALMTLERLAELVKQTQEPQDRITEYKDFHKSVRKEHDALLAALDNAKQAFEEGDFNGALALCAQYLGKYPRHEGFAALKFEIEQRREEQQIAYRADVDQRLGNQPNLDGQLQILEEALSLYPQESSYGDQLRRVRELQAEVASVLDAAQVAEDADDFEAALTQWARLRSRYPQYPGLDEQISRVTKARAQAQAAAKTRWARDIERALDRGDLDQSGSLLTQAGEQFPGEFTQLQHRHDQAHQRRAEARRLLSEANALASGGRPGEAIEGFRKAYDMLRGAASFKRSVIEAMVGHAQGSLEPDWKVAEQYLQGALALDPAFPAPKEIRLRIEARQEAEFVGAVLARATDLEKKGGFKSALSEIDGGLARYPGAKPLRELRTAVEASQTEFELKRAREDALRRVLELAHRAEGNLRDQEPHRIRDEALALAQRYPGDSELNKIAAEVGQQLLDLQMARTKVVEDDLEGARSLASRYLSLSPKHAGFLDIQAQVSERELQLAIEYMDEVNQRLLAESILERRLEILEEALRRYPDEPHYREQLDLVLAEQSLVGSIVEEATALEKAGQYKEALEQWRRLSTIHRPYPDLEAHIARVSQLQEQVLREAEVRWIAQIGKALDEWDFAQALELVRKAQVDFPDGFRDLEDRARQGADRRAGARRLIAEAHESSRKERWEEGRAKLREAHALAPGDPLVENQIAAEYARAARTSLKSDWKVADALLQEASALAASFVPPADLTAKIEEKRHIEFVEQALRESKQRRESDGVQAALDVIQAALNAYPGEARLAQEKDSLDLELRKITEEQERQRVLEELWQMEGVTRTMVTSPLELDRILNRAQDIARNHPKDSELNSFSETLREQVEALQRARELLEAGQTDESESITDRMLERFEKHSAFQALKQAIQDARAQAAADYMDEITHRLREGHDLNQGEALLLEAVEKYPAEPYYQQELDFLREKQQLVAEIVKGAREAEQAGHLDEALDLWKKLQTVHRHYAGLDAEMSRITAILADKQSSARRLLLAEAGNAIQEHDFQHASKLLRRIESEFGKPAAEECARLQARMDATVAALQLADEGRSLLKDGKDAEGSVKFIAAARKVPEDHQLIGLLLEELVQRTGSIVGADWRRASALVQAIHDIDSKHAALSGLRATIADSKREEAVAGFLKQARGMLDGGDLRSAEKAMIAALETYPDEIRLTECLAEVRALLAEESRRQKRAQALKELAGIENEAPTANPKRLKKALKEIDSIAARASSDPEVQERANAIKTTLAARIAVKAQRGSPEKPGPVAAPGSVESRRTFIWLGAGIAAAAAVGAFIISRGLFSSHDVPVTITSEVAGASVNVGAKACVTPNCAMNLPAGNYTLTAKKDGYKPVAQSFTISSQQAPVKLPLTFDPLPQVLEVNTNFESGRVQVDGRAAGDLRDGRFVLPALAPGQHTVRVTGGQADFQAEWRSSIGERPVVVSPITAKDLDATVITSMGEATTVTCNCGVQDVMVDGVQAGQTAEAPGTAVPLKNLKEGSHEISIGSRSLVVDTRLNPTVRLFLALDRNVGMIVVETGVEDATIYLNKRAYKTNAQNGVLRLPVDVGRYSIRAEKEGYKYSGQPPRQIDIRKGEEMRVSALLTVELPVLDIVGALPGAQVRLDGTVAGETDANGSFRRQVQVGEHVIEITRDEYTPVRFALQFGPGKTVRPDRGQVTMARAVRPPLPPDPVQIEAQDWERIRTSNNIVDFDDFLKRHATGAHAADARSRADQLRLQQAANTAKQADQAAWEATDRNSKASLQDYLRRFANGAHAQEAQGFISGLDKQAADKAAADKAAADKTSADKVAADRAAQAKEQARAAAAEIQAVNGTIKAYETAYNDMKLADLQRIWPGMPKTTRDSTSAQFRDAKTVSFKLEPIGQPMVSGNSATVTCTRTSSMVPKSGKTPPPESDRVTVILDRSPTGWLIRSIN